MGLDFPVRNQELQFGFILTTLATGLRKAFRTYQTTEGTVATASKKIPLH